MPRVAVLLVMSSLLAATAGCSSPEATPVECRPGRSTLTSIDPSTGDVAWQATLNQASELPLRIEDGAVVVTAPCGAAVVSLADGDVRYDDATPGDVVGVIGNRLFTLDESEDDAIAIAGIDLDTSEQAGSFSTNTPFQDAIIADRSLVTLYGDELEAADQAGTGPSWHTQIPAYRRPRLVHSGHLVLVTADDGSTFAVDLAGGTLAWRTVPPVAATSYGLRVTGVVPGTVLTAASTGGDAQRFFVYATDMRTGRLRWTRPALGVAGADREITVLRTARALEAVDTSTGALRWRRPASSIDVHAAVPTAALTRGIVVLPQPGSPALGLDRSTGRVRWRGPETSTVVADGEVVVAPTHDGVTAIDARTGAVRWSRTVERIRQELAVAPDGQLLLLDSDVVPHLGA